MKPYYETTAGSIYCGDALEVLKSMGDCSVQCCITSPPYWALRSYLPDRVTLKKDAPEWVIKELKEKGIFPIDNTKA